ncbi:MAG: signal transduction histidine kinase (STHK), LytS [Hydrococcus sp. SU_1_0]|nr:signal transduction histidine kinase (STHK), LytS [Hydrococcus sp. SU_1_0]
MLNTILNQHRRVVGIFSGREAAGVALDQIVLSGFPLAQVFLIGKDGYDPETSLRAELFSADFGKITGTATGLKKGMALGNIVGGTTGLLLGVGLIALPGVGQLMLSSAIAFILISGGICTAAGGLTGALIGLGVTSEQAKAYSQKVSEGSFLLIVEGTISEIERARHLLEENSRPQ